MFQYIPENSYKILLRNIGAFSYMTTARESTTIWKGGKLYRIQSETDSVKGILAFFLSITMWCFSVKGGLDVYS